MFATSDNRLLGVRLFERLKDLDAEIIALEKRLKLEGTPLRKSPKYRKLNNRIKGLVTNEVNRILNILISEGHSVYAFEDLDFRHGGLSKTMNRILSRCGRSAVRKKIDAMEEETGHKVVKVNPAYTSQECSGCGFVCKDNRKKEKFECLFCGLKLNSDINAARVILRRSQDSSITASMSKERVLAILDGYFLARWGKSARVLRDLHSKKDTGLSVSG